MPLTPQQPSGQATRRILRLPSKRRTRHTLQLRSHPTARRIQVQQFRPSPSPALGSTSEKAGGIRPFSLWRFVRGASNMRVGMNVLRRSRPWQFLPWLVLLVGIPASVFVFSVLSDAVEDVAQLRFERQASDAQSVIEG